ncbi:MAG: amidohydrolase [Bacteroidales bacterium]
MKLLDHKENKELISLRKWLHQNPELSGNEKYTSEKLIAAIEKTKPDKLIKNIGGFGFAAVYVFEESGPAVLVRADMDALPIHEVNTFQHRSEKNGVAHKCGHDGHSSILAGLGGVLRKKPLETGRVILLFQPEEETGEGAAKVLSDEAFKMIMPDYSIALHNLPGYEINSVINGKGPFAAASTGMIIKIKGLSSHAAHPEQGNSPVKMLAEAMQILPDLPEKKAHLFQDFALLTIIHARLGEVAFGTNPGDGVIMATLRTFLDKDLQNLKKEAEKTCKTLAEEHRLNIEISYTEEFPATMNDPMVADLLSTICKDLGKTCIEIQEPFRWSEDFGHFTSRFPSVLFGVGSGKDSPGLHNSDYDFPDEIMPGAIELFYELIRKLTETKKH